MHARADMGSHVRAVMGSESRAVSVRVAKRFVTIFSKTCILTNLDHRGNVK